MKTAENRLFLLLNTFSKQEWKAFGRFVHSPFFNQQKILIAFFDYLHECYRELKLLPTNAQIYKKIYGKQTYDDVRVRILISNLQKLAEQYLIHSKINANNVPQKTILLHEYRKRKLPKHFDRTAKKIKQELDVLAHKNDNYYQTLYEVQREELQQQSSSKRMAAFNFQEVSDNIDLVFLIQKLRQACFSLSHQAIYKSTNDFGLLNQALAFIKEKNILQDAPMVAAYYYSYQLMSPEQSDDIFQAWKKLILKEGDNFPHDELRDINIFGINYCIKKFNEGDNNYSSELFEMYKEGLRKEFLFTDNILSRFTYRNIATMGMISKEYDWVEDFLIDYKNKLERKYRQHTFEFNLGRLKYERKEYDAALDLLQKAEYRDLLLNLSAKSVLLKIYFEQDAFDVLDSHLQAMRVFIRRKKIIGYHKENYQNLIHYTSKLLELNDYDKAAKQQLKAEIDAIKQIAERSWLLEKLA